MRLLASTTLVIVTCCALCDYAVTLVSLTVKTPAQGLAAQRACFRISQSLLTLDRLGPTRVYDAVVFTIRAVSITSGGITTAVFLTISHLLAAASRRKHMSPEAKKLVRLAGAWLNMASVTWAFISLLRHVPGFCPVCEKNGSPDVNVIGGYSLDKPTTTGGTLSNLGLVKNARRRRELTTLRNITFISCYDGDTCFFTLPEVVEHVPELAPLFGARIAVRIYGIDCPELGGRAKCARERQLAIRARDVADSMLRSAISLQVTDARPDKFFRVLGRLILNNSVELGKELVRGKLAVEYSGKARSGETWCM
ncbi:uncharacterized protein MICPUCDRAFT_55188 [Micromonas pusilla CCMP1545]|uniref:Predicted protein n=1 Tax=Micromonas pusilla (strain CCMP1545) TaxID=564608 RepID=C1MK21_MICPC|nr:uncharacterized protein MICPUCDRAFT_55188 [Micromonas pusilla CCMP1545]EEH59291.1 predicted protein [Micromonas pusilla CCMP1545]|eukprot:XP_003055915.1 predicted protein [Micromonas pusilla CCMP1545]